MKEEASLQKDFEKMVPNLRKLQNWDVLGGKNQI
jgi:hypothetical protein